MVNKEHTYSESNFESCADDLLSDAQIVNTSEDLSQSKNLESDHEIRSGVDQSSLNNARFGAAILLKTAQIIHTKPLYRDEKSFHDEDFEVLRDNIHKVGINVEPITVRDVKSASANGPAQYELVQGGRRLQACIDAGVNVLAIVCNKPRSVSYDIDRLLSDTFKKKLSPYEYGLQLQLTLAEDWHGSDSGLARLIGINKSKLSRSLALANVPNEVLEIVSDTRELRSTDGSKLLNALKLDKQVVMQEVLAISTSGRALRAKEVVKILLACVAKKSGVAACNTPNFFIINDQNMGEWHKKKNGNLEFKFELNVSSKDQPRLIKKFSKILESFAV